MLLVVWSVIMLGVGSYTRQGDRLKLDNNETYNIIAIVDPDAPGNVAEIVISETDDPNDHHFAYIYKDCLKSYHTGANYLLQLSTRNCIWLP